MAQLFDSDTDPAQDDLMQSILNSQQLDQYRAMTHGAPEPAQGVVVPGPPDDRTLGERMIASGMPDLTPAPLLPDAAADWLASALPGTHTRESLQNSANMASGLIGALKWNPEPFPVGQQQQATTKLLLDQITALKDQGHSFGSIGKKLNLTIGQVAGVLNRAGLTTPVPRVMTDEAWKQAKELFGQGLSQKEIARGLGASSQTVSRAFKQQTPREYRRGGPAGGSYRVREPSMPTLNLPPEEPLDPADIAEFMKVFGHK